MDCRLGRPVARDRRGRAGALRGGQALAGRRGRDVVEGRVHGRARRVLARLGLEVLLHAGQDHLQRDRARDRDRDAADGPRRAAGVELQAADGELPRHRAAAEARDGALDHPRQQRRDADQQRDRPGGDAHFAAVGVRRREDEQARGRQQQPPP